MRNFIKRGARPPTLRHTRNVFRSVDVVVAHKSDRVHRTVPSDRPFLVPSLPFWPAFSARYEDHGRCRAAEADRGWPVDRGLKKGGANRAREYVRPAPTARSVAFVTIDGDKRVSGAGIVYPSYCGSWFFFFCPSPDGRPVNGSIAARKLRTTSLRNVLFKPRNHQREFNSPRSQIFIITLSIERQSCKGPAATAATAAAELSNHGWRFQSGARGWNANYPLNLLINSISCCDLCAARSSLT